MLPSRVLAIGAHPDDIEILCGGTMALYAQAGATIVLCSASAGEAGLDRPPNETAAIRKQEAQTAANLIGAESICLDLPDCGVNYADREALRSVIDLIRQVRPEVVFTHDPEDYHADHRAVSRLVQEATFASAVPAVQTDSPATAAILPVFYMDSLAGIGFVPEHYVDISSTYDLKRSMLEAHTSQIDWMANHAGFDFLDFMETMSKFRGIQCGVSHAEAFRSVHAWLRERPARLLP